MEHLPRQSSSVMKLFLFPGKIPFLILIENDRGRNRKQLNNTFTSSKLEPLAGSHLEVEVVSLDQIEARPSLLGQLADVRLEELLRTRLLAFLLAIILVPVSLKQNMRSGFQSMIFFYLHIPHSRKACSVFQSCQNTTLESYPGKVPEPCKDYGDLFLSLFSPRKKTHCPWAAAVLATIFTFRHWHEAVEVS